MDATGDRIAQRFNTGEDDLIGSWRWRVWLDHKMHEGSAHSGTEARETCERLLAEYQQAQMAQKLCVFVYELSLLIEKPQE